MTERQQPSRAGDRAELETLIANDIRALTAVSEQIGHVFARANELRANDFRALMHVAHAETEGRPLTAGQLSTQMGMSQAAVTYLVERMIDSGHLRREIDPTDRRRVLLHYDEHGMALAREFFGPLGERNRAALADLPAADLDAAHRVLRTVIEAMRSHYAGLIGSRPAPRPR
ncbi:MarR family winged helix-turn-helix transcriptional regulator [Nocardia sp. CDC159]|uniref:MarR family winged helix-turn-helix transcriptional regulator n=1 Tax=Nocardia pulmonis TaxID=2951408 RepID=A0A9X2E7L1_9NOCA|nr:MULTISPECIES: MarR family winged helix-turn-helix transcriptional regulator [Nocardia]MCM6775592.1 MarR family winged helix-turn-helix transcriptional regulator [Nocardia pulmonis]MCM6787674.1 MarR family winged helix-turn-helix transcriptional regulator [Nocardia sp. CDC159]